MNQKQNAPNFCFLVPFILSAGNEKKQMHVHQYGAHVNARKELSWDIEADNELVNTLKKNVTYVQW